MANAAPDPRFTTLREQAERALSRHDAAPEQLTHEAMQELVHELRVHQVELQLQNEELQRARLDAEAERDRFAALYESVPVGCLTTDRQGVIREANRSGGLLLGGTSRELLGHRLDEWVATDDQDAYFLFMRRLFQTGLHQGVLTLWRSESEPWVAQIDARVVNTGPNAGETCRLVLSDISARQQADALRAQRDWLDVTLSSMGDGLITTDTQGLITFVNRVAVEFTGWPAERALGRSLDAVWPLVDEHTRQPAGGWVSRVLQLETGDEPALHTVLVSRDGAERIVSACAAPILPPTGPPHGVVVVFRDIGAQRQLETHLRQAQKLESLGTLAGGIAHDFNNILVAILGFTRIAERGLEADNPVQPHLREVSAAALRAKELVQQILTFAHQLQVERQPVAMYAVVQEVLSLIRATLPSTITIEPHLDPGVGTIVAQVSQVHQVLVNLCANAEYAMRPQGGTLRIGLDAVEVDATVAAAHPPLEPGPHIRLMVEDTGAGVAAEELPHLFEPYYTTKEPGEGTGLGLAVVHGIVSSYQGTITVESTLGMGTTFTIYLPRAADAEPPASADPEALSGGSECILLVEDQETVALATEIQLVDLGYTVVTHHSSLSALEAFRADPHQFDLVLTDQTMPDMTGGDLAQALHRIRPEVPIILVTGFSHLINADAARALGIDAFLLKPWDIQELSDTIRRVLAQRCAQDVSC